MVGFAAYFSWTGELSAKNLDPALDRIAHRGAKRSVVQRGNACFGVVHDESRASEDFLVETDDGLVCVADARLDNEEELRHHLSSPLPPARLLAECYRRWGQELPERLYGDFAFVVWNGRGDISAARDPFGIRPLYYAVVKGGLCLASEIDQLLELAGPNRLDAKAVVDYLDGEYRCASGTLFEGIQRVRPGHRLQASAAGLREERYWQPPRQEFAGANIDECVQEFRAKFRKAVSRRLVEAPVVAQLSGGLDSSSIVCMADSLSPDDDSSGPGVYLSSAQYPGLDCDEFEFVQEVADAVRFPLHGWDGTQVATITDEERVAAHPWAGSHPEQIEGDVRLAHDVGARAILSGFGGDEVLFESGVFRELAQRGWWWTLLRQLAAGPGYSTRSRWSFAREAVASRLPAGLRRLFKGIRPPLKSSEPQWLNQNLKKLWRERPEEPSNTHKEWEGAPRTWQVLVRPQLWWSIELQTLRAARNGLELRFPYLDRELVEFVLSVPLEYRLPQGRMKQLLRRSMAGLVPERILRRGQPTTFDSVLSLIFEKNIRQLHRLFAESDWLAAPYVDRPAIREMFEGLVKQSSASRSVQEVLTVLDIVQFEYWLRFLHERQALAGSH